MLGPRQPGGRGRKHVALRLLGIRRLSAKAHSRQVGESLSLGSLARHLGPLQPQRPLGPGVELNGPQFLRVGHLLRPRPGLPVRQPR